MEWHQVQSQLRQLALPSIIAQIEKELAVVQQTSVPPLPARKNLIQRLEPRARIWTHSKKLVDWKRLRARNFASSRMSCMARRGLLVELFRRNGVACDEIRGTRDPRFGGVHPEPIEPHIEALRQAVLAGKFDAGLCADGDGDRIGAIDRDGMFVNPHQIFALLVWHLRERATCRETLPDVLRHQTYRQLAAKFDRKLHETPSASSTSAS